MNHQLGLMKRINEIKCKDNCYRHTSISFKIDFINDSCALAESELK